MIEVFIITREEKIVEVCGSPEIAEKRLRARSEQIALERMQIDWDQDRHGFTVTHPLAADYAAHGTPWPPAKYRIQRHQVVYDRDDDH